MTQDEIIRMAREAGAMFDHISWVERDLAPVFERFATLVAEETKEKAAKVLLDDSYAITFQSLGQYRTACSAAIRSMK
jgi:hypothetical protein